MTNANGLTLALCLLSTAHAADIRGTVTSVDGDSVAGAIVSLTRADGVLRQSVYSDASGRFLLGTGQSGAARLSVRAPGFADESRDIAAVSANPRPLSITLARLSKPAQVSDALPASAHAARVHLEDERIRQGYRSQCFYCHQLGNAWTRRPRTETQWRETIDRMERYGALLTWPARRQVAAALAASFDGRPIPDRQTHVYDPATAGTTLTEVAVAGNGAFVHDVELGDDGLFYSVDMANDRVYVTDLATAQSTALPMPDNGLPLHGDFAGASAPVAAFHAHHGPHSIVRGPDGRLYTTNSMSAEIGVLDPATERYSFHNVGGGAVYPHTLRFDRYGVLWFSIALSNQLGRFDPRTGAMQVIDLPAGGFWQGLTDATLTGVLKIASLLPGKDLQLLLSHHKWSGQGHRIFNLPYGLDIHPVDGSVWYAKLYADKIGRYDPKTGAISEWDTPLPGPRRMRFAPDGTLWIPAFGGSGLLKFEPDTQQFTRHPMPVLAPDEFETPYALNVHPQTGDVWITSNQSDRMFRFTPASARWTAYPMPTRTTYMRDIVFTADGSVCSTNSNLPPMAIEDQMQSIVCLRPGETSQ
ncbi:carboxypeptidase regulatory-like domain-containing protein [Sinimarinibacterium sp. CAU 1509]|uniref:carboxypeptidase regulatory-like domain-containing protein n=1 Tax=Sinimarinibacterium sp. CAU 1509 TaxID=2562283 RepID=UPI00146C8B1B|nr:carboxypeptidase regulatory-like domain-containing protein [Sinimarinibacterium sp. CAU 1509]